MKGKLPEGKKKSITDRHARTAVQCFVGAKRSDGAIKEKVTASGTCTTTSGQ